MVVQADTQEEFLEYEEVIAITPEMAKEWRAKFGNERNRRTNLARVRALRDLMEARRWEISGEFAISFDRTGMLINGHHRLVAVQLYGRPVTFVVRRNVDIDALRYVDSHQARTRGQIGRMFGIDTSYDDALRLIALQTSAGSDRHHISDMTIERLRERLSTEVALVHQHANVKFKRRRLRAGVRAGLVVIARVRTSAAVAFFQSIGPVCERATSEPRATVNLVNWMENHSAAGNTFQMEHLAVTINAFEQFVTGANLKTVRSDGLSSKESLTRRMLDQMNIQ